MQSTAQLQHGIAVQRRLWQGWMAIATADRACIASKRTLQKRRRKILRMKKNENLDSGTDVAVEDQLRCVFRPVEFSTALTRF